MNILSTLTLKHLKLNKKRTIVTIIGIILSAAMMSAVTTLVVSIKDLLVCSTIERTGNWHVIYNNITSEQAKSISEDKFTKMPMYIKTLGYATYDKIKNQDKPYIYIKEYDSRALENISRLRIGRLPQNSDEILIPEHLNSNGEAKLKIGDTITLNIGERVSKEGVQLGQSDSLKKESLEIVKNSHTKTFTIVGMTTRPDILIEPYSAPGYTVVTFLDKSESKAAKVVDLALFARSTAPSFFDKAAAIADKHSLHSSDAYVLNTDLLRVSGSFASERYNIVLYGSVAIIMLLIIIGSVALIYNAFSISVTDRLKQFGMLSSVGATKKQLRKAVRTEAAIVTSIGLPIGIICGIVGIGITMLFINPLIESIFEIEQSLRLMVSPLSILVAALLVIVTVWISSAIPANRALTISPVEAIRQTEDIKMKKREVKTSFLTRKLFKLEGDIALKNLKRNRKKYRATLFSLIISIVLFITVSSFTMYIKKSADIGITNYNYDLLISIDSDKNDAKVLDKFYSEVKKLDGIKDSSAISRSYFDSNINKDSINSTVLKKFSDEFNFKNNTLYVQTLIYTLDDISFEKYLNQIGEKPAKYIDTKNPTGILVNKAILRNSWGKSIETQQVDWKAGMSFEMNSDKDKAKKQKITIGKASDILPIGMEYSNTPIGLQIIVNKEVGNAIMSKIGDGLNQNIYLVADNYEELQTNILKIQRDSTVSSFGLSILNPNSANKSNEEMLILISVFIYGFISLITLIGIANIFNTISTNITLRRREFAMLKSVGMTPASFRRMINFESMFYGIKALLYGLPISFVISYLMYFVFRKGIEFQFSLPWLNIAICIVGVMVIVSTTMMYSSSKIRRENIIDALRQENI